jgi:hypothetical protein
MEFTGTFDGFILPIIPILFLFLELTQRVSAEHAR